MGKGYCYPLFNVCFPSVTHPLAHFDFFLRGRKGEPFLFSPCMCDAYFAGPGHGSPRPSTGTEEMTPREAGFHVFPRGVSCFPFLCILSLYPCTHVFLCHGRHSSEPYACRRHHTTLAVCNDNFMTPRRAPTCSSHNAPGIWQAGRGLEPHCLMRVHASPSPNAGAGAALTAGRMESAAGSCVPQIWSFDQNPEATRIVRPAVKTSH